MSLDIRGIRAAQRATPTPLGLFAYLPEELRGRVVSFLDPSSALGLAATSRMIYSLTLGIMNRHQRDGLKNYITNLCLSLSEDAYAEIRHGLEFTKSVISSETRSFKSLTEHSTSIQRIIFGILSRLDVEIKIAVLEGVSIPSFCNDILRLKTINQSKERVYASMERLAEAPEVMQGVIQLQGIASALTSIFIASARYDGLYAAYREIIDIAQDIDLGMGPLVQDSVFSTGIPPLENFQAPMNLYEYLNIVNHLVPETQESHRILLSACKTLCARENIDIALILELTRTMTLPYVRDEALLDLCIKLLKEDLPNLNRVFEIAQSIQAPEAYQSICDQLLKREDVDSDLVFDNASLITNSEFLEPILRSIMPRLIREEKKSLTQIVESVHRIESVSHSDWLLVIICRELLKKEAIDLQQIIDITYSIQNEARSTDALESAIAYSLHTEKYVDKALIFKAIDAIRIPATKARILQDANRKFAPKQSVDRIPQDANREFAPIDRILHAQRLAIQFVGQKAFDLAMQNAPSQDAAFESIAGTLVSQGNSDGALQVARYIENPNKRARLVLQLL